MTLCDLFCDWTPVLGVHAKIQGFKIHALRAILRAPMAELAHIPGPIDPAAVGWEAELLLRGMVVLIFPWVGELVCMF